jgi:hypothetical protein
MGETWIKNKIDFGRWLSGKGVAKFKRKKWNSFDRFHFSSVGNHHSFPVTFYIIFKLFFWRARV